MSHDNHYRLPVHLFPEKAIKSNEFHSMTTQSQSTNIYYIYWSQTHVGSANRVHQNESGDKNCVLCVCTLHRFIPMSGISINTGLLTTHKYAHITKKDSPWLSSKDSVGRKWKKLNFSYLQHMRRVPIPFHIIWSINQQYIVSVLIPLLSLLGQCFSNILMLHSAHRQLSYLQPYHRPAFQHQIFYII